MIKELLNSLEAEKIIKKQQKKYKNKKVIIYGAGEYSQYIFENYDLSGFDIVAVADMKYKENSQELFYSHRTISPSQLANEDFDVILLNLLEEEAVFKYLKSLKLHKKTDILVKPTLSAYFKHLLKREFKSCKNDSNW